VRQKKENEHRKSLSEDFPFGRAVKLEAGKAEKHQARRLNSRKVAQKWLEAL
jgi:hypothetical protein